MTPSLLNSYSEKISSLSNAIQVDLQPSKGFSEMIYSLLHSKNKLFVEGKRLDLLSNGLETDWKTDVSEHFVNCKAVNFVFLFSEKCQAVLCGEEKLDILLATLPLIAPQYSWFVLGFGVSGISGRPLAIIEVASLYAIVYEEITTEDKNMSAPYPTAPTRTTER